ncbi:dihydrodipicolinate synthase family protein [Ottowia sp.]|uniref:dihydrodipicolinate synthase family protein n=1 Tax=Ottowia sp. TaxID=1898956 RepID=UPI0039E4DD51
MAAARALWLPLLPFIEAAFAEPNPAGLKAALALHGEMSDELRPPMQPASAALRERLAAISRALNESPAPAR